MSAARSHTPLKYDAAGFRDHVHGDAVLPSSPEEEQLTPIPTARDAPSTTNTSHSATFAPFPSDVSPFSTEDTSFDGGEHNDLLMGMNEFEPPDFSNTYLTEAKFEAKFGDFPSAEMGDPGYSRDFNFAPLEEPLSATSTTSRSANTVSRKSTGLATLSSSNLMSPQLTDAASPPSGFEGGDIPIHQHRLLGGGNWTNTSSNATGMNFAQPVSIQTPAATGSSVDVSPNLDQIQGRFPAPRVQIENYGHGDSPTRTGDIINHISNRKRRGSRSSSHLAAPAIDSSEDGAYDEPDDDAVWNQQRPSTLPGPPNLRQGLDPSQRATLDGRIVVSLRGQQKEAELNAKNAEVSQWLSNSDGVTPSNTGQPSPVAVSNRRHVAQRSRAKSTGNCAALQADAFVLSRSRRAAQDAAIPGPGLLVAEASEEEEDGGSARYTEEVPASVDNEGHYGEAADYFPLLPSEGPGAQDAHPWIDPISFPSQPGRVGQPGTSNEAMMRFAKRARDIETVSRAATWGTNPRRLSDSDLQRVFGAGGLFSRLSVGRHAEKEQDKENYKDDWRQFKESVEIRVLNFLPKRSASSAKRKQSEPTQPSPKDQSPTESARKDSTHKRKESLQSLHERKESLSVTFKRLPSVKRPKSPKLNTAGTALPPGGAYGRGQGPTSPSESHSPTHKHGVFRHAREMLSRHSSRDASEPNLATLWTQSGGPPLPNISSPPNAKEVAAGLTNGWAEDGEGDASEAVEERGVKMDLAPRHDFIIPTFDGFKMNVRDVNPRLPAYLVERIGQEQLRRYKKLVEFKVKHAQATRLDKCESRAHCVERGGVATYFPAKIARKEAMISNTESVPAGTGEVEDDEDAVQDGIVTEAQFPPGVPMPPVKRLPAEFECPLCFGVKKFTKPSDWSKHVHEDLQPFTCTFPTCPDPKSFKRKADWVRHENERHRQLEWWQCTDEGCAHQCYRRDNFVQHLVREHKMPEPKAKTIKPDNRPAVRGPAKTKGRGNKDYSAEDRVLMMVEKCRRETTKNPMDEPCKFCGNVCNTFKKLTVHLARHMEQISMPVLELVKMKDVTPDTIVSPIEAKLPQTSISPGVHASHRDSLSGSPFERPQNVSTMQEAPGAFAPIHVGSNFQQAQFNNDVPWMMTNTRVNIPLQVPTATEYDGGIANQWMHASSQYPNGQGTACHAMIMTSSTFPDHQAAVGSGVFHQLQTPMPHGVPVSFNDTGAYAVDMGQQPQFHIPEYMNNDSDMPANARRIGSHLHYAGKEQDACISTSNGQALYVGQQQQQPMHQHTQQQQYYGSS